MTITEQRKYVATTILDQLARTSGGAGAGRLRAMMSAATIQTLVGREFEIDAVPNQSPGVGFRFKGCKNWNGVEIFLDQGNDTYILRFYQILLKSGTVALGKWMDDIYAEDLSRVFTDATGLDTHL